VLPKSIRILITCWRFFGTPALMQQLAKYSIATDREFVTSAKKIANFNEIPKLKKIVKIRTKIR